MEKKIVRHVRTFYLFGCFVTIKPKNELNIIIYLSGLKVLFTPERCIISFNSFLGLNRRIHFKCIYHIYFVDFNKEYLQKGNGSGQFKVLYFDALGLLSLHRRRV